MTEKRNPEAEGSFYQTIAELLETHYDYEPFPHRKRTRWNNRKAGNGRFENFGLVRMFGPNLVHVALYRPFRVSGWYTPEAIIQILEKSVDSK